MRRLEHRLRYDGAGAAEVYAMLAAPEFREAVCVHQGFTRHSVSVELVREEGKTLTEAGMRVQIEQYRPTDGLPGFAQKLVGPEIGIVQREDWTSPTTADLSVTVPGKPGQLRGTIALDDDAGGVVETVTAEVTVGIPLIGGRLEELIASMLLKALDAENHVGARWLAGERG